MLSIKLPLEIEQALLEQARQQGTTPEQLAIDTLRYMFVLTERPAQPAVDGETLADFLGDSLGVLSSSDYVPGGARMSESTGERFAEGLLEKRKQGRL